MKHFFITLTILLSCATSIFATDTVDDYFKKCRQSNSSDYATVNKIVSAFDSEKLLKALSPYYSDSVLFVRRQAYYLTYKKGIQNKVGENTSIVSRLVMGLNDSDNGLRGMILGYLQSFLSSDFDTEAQTIIVEQLKSVNRPHHDQLLLLAGFVGAGREELLNLLLKPELPTRKKWNIALALARIGDEKQVNYCVEKVRQAPINSGMVSYLLPDLVYTRQKAALDYCVELLYSDKKLCATANPNLSDDILCAYPIIELLAPVIVDFPVKVDAGIGINTNDYPKMLQTVRDWFNANKDYRIQTDIY